ncbi:MAG: DciA family protein [Streptosporangiales bacterium]
MTESGLSSAATLSNGGTVDVLAFSRDLASFKSHLQWLISNEAESQVRYGSAVRALEALLSALESGRDPVDGISCALSTWRNIEDRRQRLDEEAREDRERAAAVVRSLSGRWEQIVGPELAAHTRPSRLDHDELLVIADSTAWATQVRLLAVTLAARLNAELGDGVITKVAVNTSRPRRQPQSGND